jgi:ribosome production factor 2
MSGSRPEKKGRAELRAALQQAKDKRREQQRTRLGRKSGTLGGSGATSASGRGKKVKGSRNNASDNAHRRGVNNTVWYGPGDEGPVEEPIKPAVLVKAASAGAVCGQILRDFQGLLKPYCVTIKEERKNFTFRDPWRPFEDIQPFEQIAQSKSAGWIVHASHSKKRPHNLTLMRFFAGHVLDMAEVGTPSTAPPPAALIGGGWHVGNKPCFLFVGEEFDEPASPLQRLANMIVDLFGGHRTSRISLRGLEHVICVTYAPLGMEAANAAARKNDSDDDDDGDDGDALMTSGKAEQVVPPRRHEACTGLLHFRTYQVRLKKSGTRTPFVELSDMGPNMDWELRRTRFASADNYKEACKQPPQAAARKVKNVTSDSFAKTGRMHMQRQDLQTLRMKKTKALTTQATQAGAKNNNSKGNKRRGPEKEDGEADSEFGSGRKQKQARRG